MNQNTHATFVKALCKSLYGLALPILLASCGGGGGTTNDAGEKTTPTLKAPTLVDASAQTYTAGQGITALEFTNLGGGDLLQATGCTVSPKLPAGLVLSKTTNNQNCQITGTPAGEVAVDDYTITATNATGSGATTVSITVSAAVSVNPVGIGKVQLTSSGDPAPLAGDVLTLRFETTGQTNFNPQVRIGGQLAEVDPGDTEGQWVATLTVEAGFQSGDQGFEVAVVVPQGASSTEDLSQGITIASVPATSDLDLEDTTAFLLTPILTLEPTSYSFTKDRPITSITFANGGGVVAANACSVNTPLPQGLSLAVSGTTSENTCEITGTPEVVVDSTDYIITATNDTGEGALTVTIIVNKKDDTLSFPNANEGVMAAVGDAMIINQIATATSGRARITYTSATPTVATVALGTGVVTIVGAGEAIITATLVADTNYNEAVARYTLTVNDPSKQNDTLTFGTVTNNAVNVSNDGTMASVTYATNLSFTWVATSVNATGTVTYTSDNIDVATVVRGTGVVTLVGAGEAIITAMRASDANYNLATARYTLTVAKGEDTLSFPNANAGVMARVGDAMIINQIATAMSGRVGITYTSATPTVATVVLGTGAVTIVGVGTAIITATLAGGDNYNVATARYTLTVAKGDDTLSFPNANAGVMARVGDAMIIDQIATAMSGRAGITYTSGTPTVATVVLGTGAVTIVGVGTAIITATLAGGDNYNVATARYTLAVNNAEDTLSFPNANAGVMARVGDAMIIDQIATATSGRAGITYTSGTPTVATVVLGTGAVTIVGVGEAIITATLAGDDNYNVATAMYTLAVFSRETISIETIQDLKDISTKLDGDYVLTVDLNLSGEGNWTPIGATNAFTGSFDGRGFEISGLTSSGRQYAGLFGFMFSANISNLGIVVNTISASSSSANSYAGGLVGLVIDSSISDSYAIVAGDISASSSSDSYAGGLVGLATSSGLGGSGSPISNSYADVTGDISASSSAKNSYAGGLAGRVNSSPTSNSYADVAGDISATSSAAPISNPESSVGGLVGLVVNSPISNSYAVVVGNISSTVSSSESESTSASFAGGLVGFATSSGPGSSGSPISDSYADVTGDISATSDAQDAHAGGLAGRVDSSPTSNSYAIVVGDISSSSDLDRGNVSGSTAGGLVGLTFTSPTSNSYAIVTGNISASGAHSSAAGLVGQANGSPTSDSYAIVMGYISVPGLSPYAGGLVGIARSSSPVSGSYYSASRKASENGGSFRNTLGTSQTLAELKAPMGLSGSIYAEWTAFYDADSTPAAHALITDTSATFDAATDRRVWHFGDAQQLPTLNPSPADVADGDLPLYRARQHFVATASSAMQIDLSWSSAGDGLSYEVYRHTADESSGATRIATPMAADGRTYMDTDTNLTTDTTYYYWLKACNVSNVCSDFFAHTQATTQ